MLIEFFQLTIAPEIQHITSSLVSNKQTIDWTSIILALIGIVTSGVGLRWYSVWLVKRKQEQSDRSADGLAFRENLLSRITGMSEKLEDMYNKQIKLVEQNARLQSELEAAHREIAQLRTEIRILQSK